MTTEDVVKALEKLTSVRLAEVLSQKGVVSTDAITDALYVQDQYQEPFAEVMISSGHISEWDLAKVVVEAFQLPFLMAETYAIDEEAKTALPQEELFETLLVPLDRFGDAMTVAMPVMTSYETLSALQQRHGLQILPYVGLISENKRVLQGLFPEFRDWLKKRDDDREQRRRAAAKTEDSADWMNIFDTGDEAVRRGG